MNELEELESIVALEDEDWEASRLAEVFIDMVKSREAGELTEAEFTELVGNYGLRWCSSLARSRCCGI
jgi:hypothetical protein